MKFLLTLTGVLIIFAAIAAMCYAAYLGAAYLWQFYASLDELIRTLTLSAMSTVLIAAMIISAAIKSSARTSSKAQLMEAKLCLYKHLVETETRQEFEELKAEMQILSSSSVLEAYAKLDQAMLAGESTDILFKQLIKSMRRDLGHGSGYDENRLKFLLASNLQRATESQHPAY